MQAIIRLALAEDIGRGDITTEATVPPGAVATAEILQKAPGVVCGLPVRRGRLCRLDPRVEVTPLADEGSYSMTDRRVVARIDGPAGADPDRRAHRAQLPAAPVGRGHRQPPRRRAGRRHPRRA